MPLLDHRIDELFAAITQGLKMKDGQLKYIYRKAIKNVIPADVEQHTDNSGFPVPTNQWSRGPRPGLGQHRRDMNADAQRARAPMG